MLLIVLSISVCYVLIFLGVLLILVNLDLLCVNFTRWSDPHLNMYAFTSSDANGFPNISSARLFFLILLFVLSVINSYNIFLLRGRLDHDDLLVRWFCYSFHFS